MERIMTIKQVSAKMDLRLNTRLLLVIMIIYGQLSERRSFPLRAVNEWVRRQKIQVS
jgi:hypothetical protein